MNLWRINKYYYIRLKRLRGNPAELAMGFAIGVFIGCTPTIPFHTVLIVLLAFLTKSSAIAGITSSWLISNPITSLPLYYLAAIIGNAVTPYELNLEMVQQVLTNISSAETILNKLAIILDLGYESLAVLGIGGILLGLPIALLSYFASLYFFTFVKRKKK